MRAKAAMELMLQNASQPASGRAAAAAALLAAQREESKDGEGGASGAAVAPSVSPSSVGWRRSPGRSGGICRC